MINTRFFRRLSTLRWLCSVTLLISIFGMQTIAVSAQAAGTASISGTLTDQGNGLPIANARVTLYAGDKQIAQSTSDLNGAYSFANIQAGFYYVDINARGYEISRSDDIAVTPGATAQIRSVLVQAARTNSTGVREIGSVRAVRGSLQTSSVITERVSSAKIMDQGVLTVGQGLLALPGISANDLDSSPGDDLHINIRGQKGSETAALIDGHPVGPIGVGNGFRGGYNYQLSPAWGFSDTQVAYGTGGLALYGTNNIGGAVNFQTPAFTTKPTASITQGIGDLGRALSIVDLSGTEGRLAYRATYGVQGSAAPFPKQTFTQSALLVTGGTGNGGINYIADASPGNVAANTWPVSGDYVLRAGLAKLKYALTPSTSATFTAYNATSWDDKTGQGDNDAWSPAYTGAFFDQNAGAQPGCAGVFVKVDDAGNTSCFTRSQFITQFSGPAGGTPVAWQAQRNQDYALRLESNGPKHAFAGTVFIDNFYTLYNRNDAGRTNLFQTRGVQMSNDFISDNNDLTMGVYAYNQDETDGTFTVGPPGAVSTKPAINQSFFDYFLKDTWNVNRHFSLLGSAWVNENSVSNTTAISPRLTAVLKPTPRDVVRFSAGSGQGVPGIGLLQGAPSWTSPGAITTPACNGLTAVVSGANPTLKPEKGTDLELSYGHRLGQDSSIQFIAFDENETNVIFSSVVPLSTLPITPGPGDPSLASLIAAIQGRCGAAAITAANLGATTSANAGTGRYRGFSIGGHQRVTRNFSFDYGYDVLSARLFNIPTLALQNNLTLIDGGQIDKIPMHQANAGLDWATPGGTEVRFDGYYVGINNGLLRPAYTYSNMSITQRFKQGLSINLGAFNLFNSQYDQFGRIGLATFQPENQFGTDTNAIQEAFSGADGENFGLPKRSIVLSVTVKTP